MLWMTGFPPQFVALIITTLENRVSKTPSPSAVAYTFTEHRTPGKMESRKGRPHLRVRQDTACGEECRPSHGTNADSTNRCGETILVLASTRKPRSSIQDGVDQDRHRCGPQCSGWGLRL
jgi:hypothetical protein